MENGTVEAVSPNPNPDAAALGLTGNRDQDLANIAKELGMPSQPTAVERTQAQPAQEPTQPTQPEAPAVEPKVEVPPKFQNPDGTVNEEALSKSTVNLEEAINRYKAKEREFQQLQNRTNNPPQAQPQNVPVPMSPLEVQIAQDILAERRALGIQTTEAQAIADARVMARLSEAKYAADQRLVDGLQRRVEDAERSRELQGLIDGDPELATPEMAEKLWAIRQNNPWINQAPQPWTAAYFHLQGMQSRGGQVKTPTPKGSTAKAPPTPVNPVSRVLPTAPKNPNQMSQAELLAAIRSSNPGFRG